MRTYHATTAVDFRNPWLITRYVLAAWTAPIWCAIGRHNEDRGWCADCGRPL